jgi:hypothetical protein
MFSWPSVIDMLTSEVARLASNFDDRGRPTEGAASSAPPSANGDGRLGDHRPAENAGAWPVGPVASTFQRWRENQEAEVLFGFGGIELSEIDDVLQSTRHGHDSGLDGRWLVIGKEVGLGDPLLLDTGSSQGVYIVLETDDINAPTRVADSLDGFAVALAELRRLSEGRENPMKLEANPVDESDVTQFEDAVRHANPSSAEWWWRQIVRAEPPLYE